MASKILPATLALAALAAGLYLLWAVQTNEAAENIPAENAVATDPAADETARMLIGHWQSDEDPNFVREFRADGNAKDYYSQREGALTIEGTWRVFTSTPPLPPSMTFPPQDGVVYILMTMEDEAYHFRVIEISNDALYLAYMDRGGILAFSKAR